MATKRPQDRSTVIGLSVKSGRSALRSRQSFRGVGLKRENWLLSVWETLLNMFPRHILVGRVRNSHARIT